MTTATLFKLPPASGNLTDRQALALELVRATRDGITPDEAGAAWHERRGIHPSDRRCRFCEADGLSVLLALRGRGLAKRRRADGAWTTSSAPPQAGYDPATAEIPF